MKVCQLLVLSCLLAGALALPSTLQDQEGRHKTGKLSAEKPTFDGMKPHLDGMKKPASDDKKTALLGDTGTPSVRSGAVSCGSHVITEGSSAVIESPNYPSNYNSYAYCAYSFTTDTGNKELQMNCETFELEGDEGDQGDEDEGDQWCEFDWLRVNDVMYCGTRGPSAVGGSRLDIVFFSDESVVEKGYRCTVTVVEPTVVPAGSQLGCGTSRLARGKYTITDGDGDYSNNVDCYYQLYADQAGDQLSVTCSQFDVEDSWKCGGDWLSLNGIRYCSTSGPSDVAAIDRMSFHWHTDSSEVRPGFGCTVTVGETPPPSDTCPCGQVNRASRIVGGEETEANEYPWQAAIYRIDRDLTFCGGTVINSLYVLTSARCTARSSASDIQVQLRKHLTGQDDNEIRFNVAQIKVHPNNDWTHKYDFALLKLATAITFPADNKIAPACMPTASNDFVGADAIVTGFGTTSHSGPKPDTLHEVTVPIISYSECASAYGDKRTITSSMICTDNADRKGWCNGDQGGPLVSLENDRYSLVGVVSRSIGCAAERYPGVYARVTDALSWIWTSAADGEYCRDPAAN
ncbi:coagulation factor X-like [Amphibalanus amphitrite]|uniref:coagulation factor X-like n=1 Tax=Amphibalanus amphitrite TaxID=1232801 RepID=UPI001C907E8A|nr:coagulation factor X-like [Amphibalanus amphitrite]